MSKKGNSPAKGWAPITISLPCATGAQWKNRFNNNYHPNNSKNYTYENDGTLSTDNYNKQLLYDGKRHRIARPLFCRLLRKISPARAVRQGHGYPGRNIPKISLNRRRMDHEGLCTYTTDIPDLVLRPADRPARKVQMAADRSQRRSPAL